MRRILYMLLLVAVLYAGLCLLMFLMQRSLQYFPQPRSVTAADATLHLTVPDAQLVVTVRAHPGAKAIVYFGGNGEDVSRNLESFGQAFPDHALYLMHYRGYGGSSGHPSEEAIARDATALFHLVHAQHPQIAVIGRSLGTGVAVRLASEQPAARLVLVTPFHSVLDIAAMQYPWLPVRLLLLDRYPSYRYAARVTIPTLLIAGDHDRTIPLANTEQLLAAFPRGVATLTVIEGVGHNDIDTKTEYLKLIQAALQ
jgi:pimeloyl-ACP methyl ester carboxylesterase